MKERDVYSEYLREKKIIRKITIMRKTVSYSFLAVFLYLLFTVSYTASPTIVILNYLALLTSFSGLIFFKMFEIPHCMLELLEQREKAKFFQLSAEHRSEILETVAIEMNLHEKEFNYESFQLSDIITIFRLEHRKPWRKIGKIYSAVYLITVVSFCIYLTSIYLETGFGRP
jgi:hypothetical protein